MSKQQFNLIVFDWDGTLMDSTSAIVKSLQDSAADLGLPTPDKKKAAHVIGLGLRERWKPSCRTSARNTIRNSSSAIVPIS